MIPSVIVSTEAIPNAIVMAWALGSSPGAIKKTTRSMTANRQPINEQIVNELNPFCELKGLIIMLFSTDEFMISPPRIMSHTGTDRIFIILREKMNSFNVQPIMHPYASTIVFKSILGVDSWIRRQTS